MEMSRPQRRPFDPRRLLLAGAGVVVLAAIWAAASAAGRGFVPTPWSTVAEAGRLLARGESWTEIGITILRVCAGFAAGYAAGVALGLAAGGWRVVEGLARPLVLFFQGVPPLLWAIPIVVVFGIGHAAAILVIALVTFPVVAVTVAEGMRTLPRELGEMLSIFAPVARARLVELVLPHLRPFLVAALDVALVLAVKASVIAEFFGANDGIGFEIQAAYQSLQVRRLFAWGLILVAVILAFNHLLPPVERLARRMRRRAAPPECGLDDVRELKGIFLERPAGSGIRLEGVSFAYRHRAPVLTGASLEVGPREIAVVSGESGIGKTTLLKLAGGLLRPSAGRVICPARIGLVFQDDRLLPWRTIAENTALPLRWSGHARSSSRCFAQFLLEEVGLSGDGTRLPEELSGGMKKRVALARCFARVPDAILLDEPFSGLHAAARRQLWEMLLRLLALHPVPVMVVTHFPEELAPAPRVRRYELRGSPARVVEIGAASGRRGAGGRDERG
jgi:ABC-type nitrate/sulfonate/bicarbonate transport system ATPase subunit/ABC-type nitrate/sulfonate/bicarbonate transport system permease component